MASIHRRALAVGPPNPLPQLLQTPAGLALLELQGTINLPEVAPPLDDAPLASTATATPIGRLDFPDYHPNAEASDSSWMRRVHLDIGPHQRLIGEVKKLPRPMAIVRRAGSEKDTADRLDLVDIVYYKLQFSQRPEPMGLEQ